MREYAAKYYQFGANVLAIAGDDPAACKRPAHAWKDFIERRQTVDEARSLPWHQPSISGVGIVLGPNGWRDIEFDGCKGFTPVVRLLDALKLPHSYRWIYKSGRGYHVIVRSPGELPAAFLSRKSKREAGVRVGIPRNGLAFEHLEVRWEACQSVVPPSKHASGITYEWLNGKPEGPPIEIDVERLVQAVESICKPAKRPREAQKPRKGSDGIERELLRRAVASAEEACNGGGTDGIRGRNDAGFWLACQLRDNRIPIDAAAAFMYEYVEAVSGLRSEPYTPEEADLSIEQAYKEEPREPWGERVERPVFQNTDLGNAERLVYEYGEVIRYCHPWRSWLARRPERWEVDATGTVDRFAYELVRRMQSESVQIEDDDARASAMKWARTSQSAPKLRAMVSLAGSMVPVLPEDLDTDGFLLNVQNGTIDLRTGELRPHRKNDLITKLAPVTYDPNATCPKWDKARLEIFNGDRELDAYFQRAVGYSATGDVSEQVIFIPWGPGANGKSVTINTLMFVLGEYAQSTRPELLLTKWNAGNGPSPGEAALKGARLVSTSESGSRQRFDEATVKRLTGGDRIRARFNRQDEIEFDPTHKIWFATNHKPVIEGTDYAIWRRIHLIPFTVTFTEDRRDPDLEAKLKAEASGILNWIIEGCLLWQRDGLNPPAAVQNATATYKGEMDVLAAFLEECCETGIQEMQVASSRLYEAYRAWCDRTGERAEKQRGFGLRMTERGFQRERRRDGYYYLGIGLKDTRQGSHSDNEDVPF